MTNELQNIEEKKELNTFKPRDENIKQSLLSKENFMHYMSVAEAMSKTELVPKNMKGKPADILLAWEMGLQLGIPMTQALQDIAVINGKPCMYGDGLLAVVQGHKDYEWIKETITGSGDKIEAECSIKRKNHEPNTIVFTVEDAEKAGLWGKPGPWSQYPKRMLQMRARGFCIRNVFSDALRGVKTVEEVSDYQPEASVGSKGGIKKVNTETIIDANPASGEAVEEKPAVEMLSDEQALEIEALCSEYEFDINRIYKGYAVSSLTEIPSHLFDKIKSRIQAEKQKGQE